MLGTGRLNNFVQSAVYNDLNRQVIAGANLTVENPLEIPLVENNERVGWVSAICAPRKDVTPKESTKFKKVMQESRDLASYYERISNAAVSEKEKNRVRSVYQNKLLQLEKFYRLNLEVSLPYTADGELIVELTDTPKEEKSAGEKITSRQTNILAGLAELLPHLPKLRVDPKIAVPMAAVVAALLNTACSEIQPQMQNVMATSNAVDTRLVSNFSTKVAAEATRFAPAMQTSDANARINERANATMAAQAQKTVEAFARGQATSLAKVPERIVKGIAKLHTDMSEPDFWTNISQQAEKKRIDNVNEIINIVNDEKQSLEVRRQALKNLMQPYNNNSPLAVNAWLQQKIVCKSGIGSFLIDQVTNAPAGSSCMNLNFWVEANESKLWTGKK